MKVTLNWLKQYVDFNWSPEELSERLTMLGIEVEGVQKLGGEFEGIVVAEVITRDKHPNADKLSLCRVNDGTSERQIVCGADNFKAGDKVALILPGSTLPAKAGEKPLTIKVGKIRGVESQGMMCSPQELGLPDQIERLLILRQDAKPGQPFAEYLGRSAGDVVFDLEITPNRPDLNSLIGIAREISAVTGNPLKMPDVSAHGSGHAGETPVLPGSKAEDLVAVKLEDSDLCPRYTARIVKGVKIGPSPDWLRNTLEKVGIRSISNVVDVTNFVMLESGEPLHAFDYHLLGKTDRRPTIVVRRAAAGEKFKTLDGQERMLTDQMLLIADERKPIALAGVMGGENTEINENTNDVLIESACFKPQNIRATSKKLELRTESSYRFERGADINICDWASRRAAQLILQTAGGTLAEGAVDAFPKPPVPKEISLRYTRTNSLLGVEIAQELQSQLLRKLGLEACNGSANSASSGRFRIPSFRVDLKQEIDLIEEITRLYGVERIPATPPRGAIGSNAYDSIHDQLADARRLLTGLGFYEAQGQTLISDRAAPLASSGSLAHLANPLSSDMNVLRSSLLPGLLDALRHNLNHRNHDLALFEIGRVFDQPDRDSAEPDQRKPIVAGMREERRLALALTGQRNPLFWAGDDRAAKFDVFDLKGALEEFLDHFGIRGVIFGQRASSTKLFLESATIQLGKLPVGEIGQVLPAITRQYDLRDPVFLAELSLDVLLSWRKPARGFKSLSSQPSVRRDVAMLVPETTTHEAVLQIVRQAKPANLESSELFDIFRGKSVPEGLKSLAYAFTYRHPERSLTDTEVNAAHQKLVADFKQKLQATIRE